MNGLTYSPQWWKVCPPHLPSPPFGFQEWSRIMLRFTYLVEKHSEELASISRDMGQSMFTLMNKPKQHIWYYRWNNQNAIVLHNERVKTHTLRSEPITTRIWFLIESRFSISSFASSVVFCLRYIHYNRTTSSFGFIAFLFSVAMWHVDITYIFGHSFRQDIM